MLLLSLLITPICIFFELIKKTLLTKENKKQETTTKREDALFK